MALSLWGRYEPPGFSYTGAVCSALWNPAYPRTWMKSFSTGARDIVPVSDFRERLLYPIYGPVRNLASYNDRGGSGAVEPHAVGMPELGVSGRVISPRNTTTASSAPQPPTPAPPPRSAHGKHGHPRRLLRRRSQDRVAPGSTVVSKMGRPYVKAHRMDVLLPPPPSLLPPSCSGSRRLKVKRWDIMGKEPPLRFAVPEEQKKTYRHPAMAHLAQPASALGNMLEKHAYLRPTKAEDATFQVCKR